MLVYFSMLGPSPQGATGNNAQGEITLRRMIFLNRLFRVIFYMVTADGEAVFAIPMLLVSSLLY
jgi:hypothetical protein